LIIKREGKEIVICKIYHKIGNDKMKMMIIFLFQIDKKWRCYSGYCDMIWGDFKNDCSF